MIRDLCNMRELPGPGDPARQTATPFNAEEEQRFRAVLLDRIGNEIAEKGWARIPAYSTEERIRLREIGRTLSERWGQRVRAHAENHCTMFFSLEGVPLAPWQA